MNRESSKLTVLYHAISSYQLLEVMLHRHLFHPSDHAALLLPDFITDKYPQWPSLAAQGFLTACSSFRTSRFLIKPRARCCATRPAPAAGCAFLCAASTAFISPARIFISLCMYQKTPLFLFFRRRARHAAPSRRPLPAAAPPLSAAGRTGKALRFVYRGQSLCALRHLRSGCQPSGALPLSFFRGRRAQRPATRCPGALCPLLYAPPPHCHGRQHFADPALF